MGCLRGASAPLFLIRAAGGLRYKWEWGLCAIIVFVTARDLIKIRGFIMVAAGTAGLLLNEFELLWSHHWVVTIIFAVVVLAGLINLGWGFWGRED